MFGQPPPIPKVTGSPSKSSLTGAGATAQSYGVDDSARDCGLDDHGLWIDATGCAHLFGGEDAMLADLGQRLNRFGLPHRLGLAGTPAAAWALARYGRTSSTNSDNVHEALAGLTVAALRLSPEILTLLRRLGLKTIGQLDVLPRTALARRFTSKEAYESVLLRLDQLFGRHEEPLTPRRPPPVYRAEQAFLEPLIEPEALAHGLDHVTRVLCRKLAKANEGAERLAFLAFRVDGDVKTLQVGASLATHDADHIGRLFTEKLSAIDPGFGIEKLALHAERTAFIEKRQKTLSGGISDVTDLDERFNQLIDRLANRLGPDAVQTVIPITSHIPEGRGAPALACKELADMPSLPPRPSCLLLRPEPIKVLAEVPDGPPLRFTWRRVARRIIRSEGPERIAPEWGGPATSVDFAAETRDYYRVEDEEGRRYWLFRKGLYDTAGYAVTTTEKEADTDHQVDAVERPGDAVGHADQVDATDRISWFIHGLFG